MEGKRFLHKRHRCKFRLQHHDQCTDGDNARDDGKADIHTVFTTLKKCLDGTSADASVTDLAGIHDGIHVFMFFELYAVFFGSIFFLGEMKHDADTDDTADYGGKVTDQYSSSGVSTF